MTEETEKALRAEIAELRERIKTLETRPVGETHIHYHSAPQPLHYQPQPHFTPYRPYWESPCFTGAAGIGPACQ